MKTMRCLTVSFLLFIAAVYIQKVEAPSALQSLVDTERAFARTSEDKGTREAFLSFIAEDGILFRPAAVNGKAGTRRHPVRRRPRVVDHGPRSHGEGVLTVRRECGRGGRRRRHNEGDLIGSRLPAGIGHRVGQNVRVPRLARSNRP